MSKIKTYVGVDIGGTNIRVALVDEQGKILQIEKADTQINLGRDHVFQTLTTLMNRLDLSNCVGAGIGVPGIIDDKNGVMKFANNLKGFEEFPMVEELSKQFDFPMFLLNDVAAAGIAEAKFGAAKGYSSVVYITISTGIGSAIIIDNQLINGSFGYAGEIGNIITGIEKEQFEGLAPGSLETESSGSALVRKANEQIEGYHCLHAGKLFEMAHDGDLQSSKIIDEFTNNVAQVSASVAHVIDPQIFVFGGGVMKSKQYFFDEIIKKHQSFVHKGMRGVIFVEALFDEPGVLGAASYAMMKI